MAGQRTSKHCHKFQKLPLELQLFTSFWRIYNALVASELTANGRPDWQLERTWHLMFDKVHYKSVWHFMEYMDDVIELT